MVNSGYSKAARIMHLLHCLFFIRARFDFQLEAVHIPGVQNQLADAISCDRLSFLFTQVPAARESQVHLPPDLVTLWLAASWTGHCQLGVSSSGIVFSRPSGIYKECLPDWY